jgi:3-phosphoshikimate 1-carboxyvinyltransferase
VKVIISPSILSGTIHAPASKSSMQRACAAALIRKGVTNIYNPGHAEDDKAAIGIIKELGANVTKEKGHLIVESQGINPVSYQIDCGESGLSIRMFTPIAALTEKNIAIHGKGSLLSRPMDFFDNVLPQLGVEFSSNEGKLPLTVKGPLHPANIVVDGSMSSQFITGLLMSYSAAGAKNVSIRVTTLASKPYIDLTLDVMKKFGLKTPENKGYEEFYFDDSVNVSSKNIVDYTVESDWSSAAFLLVAGAIAGPIMIRGLDITSTQADKKILDALMSANAGLAIEAKGIKIHPAAMNGFEFDATDCPDLFPPLAALAAYCDGQTKIKGIHRLMHKESNRAESLSEEFAKLGVKIELIEDRMIIHGTRKINSVTVHSRHDHRIAMACAVAALKAEGPVIIEEAGAVRKSYPDFYNDLKSLGADVSLPHQHYNL